jgi:hypothetical protein
MSLSFKGIRPYSTPPSDERTFDPTDVVWLYRDVAPSGKVTEHIMWEPIKEDVGVMGTNGFLHDNLNGVENGVTSAGTGIPEDQGVLTAYSFDAKRHREVAKQIPEAQD